MINGPHMVLTMDNCLHPNDPGHWENLTIGTIGHFGLWNS